MRAVKTYAEVGSDKSLILKSLPFAPGSRVEVSEKIAWDPSISGGNVQIWEGEFSGYRGRGQLPEVNKKSSPMKLLDFNR